MADWITTTEACKLSGYTPDYLRDLIHERKIKAQKWGRSWQVSRISVQAYLRSIQQQGAKRGRKRKS